MDYKHLTMEERYQIDDLRSEGFSKNEIARRIGRATSTISREMSRNKGGHVWRAHQAHEKAKIRLAKRGRANARKVSESAWEYAENQLIHFQWSPEQIAGRLKREGHDGISHETIYKRVLEDKKAGGVLHKNLRCQKLRRKRYGSNRRRPIILGRQGIEDRPAIVDVRKRIGDWEGDTIIGAGCNSGAIVTSVERVSRFTILAKVENKSPIGVTNAIIEKMKLLKGLAHTMTVDNGGEFSLHKMVSQALNMKIYFARPYHSWERGTNENTNGLVRQYFIKSMRFDKVSDDDVQRVADKLNGRPRKCLGYQTPYEVFSRACKKKGVALRI
jgi:transposase, IS30 family